MNHRIENFGPVSVFVALISGSACSDSSSRYPSSQQGPATDSGGTSMSTAATTQSHTAYSGAVSSTHAGGSGGGRSATSNSATSGGSAGGAGDAAVENTVGGAGGQGTGGNQASGGEQATTGGMGGNVMAGCSGAGYLICEDFEGTEVGAIPEAWSRHGDAIAVADDDAHTGERSLKMAAIPVWERRIYHAAAALGSAHWGRIFYKVELPVPDAFVHSTLVALSGVGPRYGASEYRVIDTVKQAVDTPDVGSLHQFLYNVQPEDSGEFAREGPYDQVFDGEWHCAEYFIDAALQSYALYVDGEEELSFEDGAGVYDRSDIPESFAELRIGWINYQEAPPGFTAWIDDIAFASERIGCGD